MFILHFEYLQAALDRGSYEPKLSAHLGRLGKGRYRKNRKDMFDVLEPHVETAMANAKRLEAGNQGRSPSQSNPGTTVHRLVGELLPYTRKGQKR